MLIFEFFSIYFPLMIPHVHVWLAKGWSLPMLRVRHVLGLLFKAKKCLIESHILFQLFARKVMSNSERFLTASSMLWNSQHPPRICFLCCHISVRTYYASADIQRKNRKKRAAHLLRLKLQINRYQATNYLFSRTSIALYHFLRNWRHDSFK